MLTVQILGYSSGRGSGVAVTQFKVAPVFTFGANPSKSRSRQPNSFQLKRCQNPVKRYESRIMKTGVVNVFMLLMSPLFLFKGFAGELNQNIMNEYYNHFIQPDLKQNVQDVLVSLIKIS